MTHRRRRSCQHCCSIDACFIWTLSASSLQRSSRSALTASGSATATMSRVAQLLSPLLCRQLSTRDYSIMHEPACCPSHHQPLAQVAVSWQEQSFVLSCSQPGACSLWRCLRCSHLDACILIWRPSVSCSSLCPCQPGSCSPCRPVCTCRHLARRPAGPIRDQGLLPPTSFWFSHSSGSPLYGQLPCVRCLTEEQTAQWLSHRWQIMAAALMRRACLVLASSLPCQAQIVS